MHCDNRKIEPMQKKRKSKQLREAEDDLLFYLEYYKEFPARFKRIADKEIQDLEEKIKRS